MVKFFNEHNLFAIVQYGFRSKISCAHAVAEITDFIKGRIDKKSNEKARFLDLQKSFDSLDYRKLFPNLSNYGFRGPKNNIRVDYFHADHSIFFQTEARKILLKSSPECQPPGSILGLFSLLMYINDLPQTLQDNDKTANFADDKPNIKSGKGNCNMQDD